MRKISDCFQCFTGLFRVYTTIRKNEPLRFETKTPLFFVYSFGCDAIAKVDRTIFCRKTAKTTCAKILIMMSTSIVDEKDMIFQIHVYYGNTCGPVLCHNLHDHSIFHENYD